MEPVRTVPETMPVEFTERVIYLAGRMEAYRPYLGGVVSFDGRLDETRLSRAMRLLLDAEPVLGCRFVADDVPPVWRRLDSLDSMRLLEVRDADEPSAEAEVFIAEPFDCTAGPQVLAALVRGTEADVLAVKVSHVAMDGGALKETLYLIGDTYRRLAEQPVWAPEPNVDGLRSPRVDAGLFEKARALMHNDVATPGSDWGVPQLGGRGHATYVTSSLDPDVFRRVVAAGRATGATVNDTLLTAYYRTLWRRLEAAPGSRTPLLVSCELRKHLPPETRTALSNISSAWFAKVPPADEESFDETLVRVVDATRAWKRAGAGRSSAIGIPLITALTRKKDLDSIGRMLFGKPNGDPQVGGLTNIGVIDDGRLDFGPGPAVADARLLPPVSHQVVALGATTFRDRLHLAIGVETAAIPEEFVTGVVNETADELACWAAASGVAVA